MNNSKKSFFKEKIKSGKAPEPTKKTGDNRVKGDRSSDGQKFSDKSPKVTKK